MGFRDFEKSTNEIVLKPLQNSSTNLEISANDSGIAVSTKDYVSGYAYSKYYCDHLEYTMMYSGTAIFYDTNGNEIVKIECTDSFSFMHGKWTLTCKVTMLGEVVYDNSVDTTSIEEKYVTIKIYFDLANKQWVFERAGVTKRSKVTEWQPTYFSVSPRMWFIISQYDSMFFDGFIRITYMNKAVGYPQAVT